MLQAPNGEWQQADSTGQRSSLMASGPAYVVVIIYEVANQDALGHIRLRLQWNQQRSIDVARPYVPAAC